MNVMSQEYVEGNRTKGATGSGFKVVCPDCGGNDCYVTLGNSTAFCFECSYVARIGAQYHRDERQRQDFDVPSIRTAYAEASGAYHSLLTPKHKAYLADRGLDDAAIDAFKIGYCPDYGLDVYRAAIARDGGMIRYNGEPWLAQRLVFPYLADNEVTDMRGRTTIDEEPKYKSCYNASVARGAIFPFNYDRAVERAQTTKRVIITEGEIKAILADLNGHACVALPGMLSWRSGTMFDADVEHIVIYDNDADAMSKVRINKALRKIATHLPLFSVVTLPLLGKKKMDIDTYLLEKQGGPQRFDYLVNNAIPYPDYMKLAQF